jgi:hypothetical protein
MSRLWERNRGRFRLAIVLCTFAAFWSMPGRADDAADSQARLLKDLKYLTSDECEGRGVGTKGIDLAADYIARGFAQAGLKPGGDKGTYFQNFQVSGGARLEKPATLVLTGPRGETITLKTDDQFAVQRSSGSGAADGGIVFVGYGLTNPKLGYDDYAGLDVAGKVVIVLRQTPRFTNPDSDPFGANDRTVDNSDYRDDNKAANAQAHKAAAVLMINASQSFPPGLFPGGARGGRGGRGGATRTDTLTPAPRASARNTGETPARVSGTEVVRIPVVQIKRDIADDLLLTVGLGLADVEKTIDRTLKPQSQVLPGWTCKLETPIKHSLVPVKNVIGVLEGSGPHADETIVIGAHYDHVGYGSGGGFGGVSTFGGIGAFGSPPLRASTRMVHHGADDNASGSAAVMELARRFASHPKRRGRRLVFMTFTAEEAGLIGSAYYGRHPVFPLDKTVAMVNFDMIGRLQDDRIEVTGVGTAKALEEMVDRLGAKYKLHLTKVQTGFGPSDHQSFTLRGVPALEFFTGFHEQYHMPSDRVETLNLPGMVKVVDLVTDGVAELGTSTGRPEYLKVTTPYPRTTALWSVTSSFGVIPNATDSKGGVLVDEVFANTPAAVAGMKAGDRIVAVGGQAAEDLQTYLHVIRALPVGEPVEVFVIREGRPRKFSVQLTKINVAQAATQFGITIDPKDKAGLRVTAVTPESTAARAGLRAGDRIVELAGKAATGGVDAMRHLLGLTTGDSVELAFERDGKIQKAKVHLTFDVTAVLGRPARGPRGG